MTPEKFEELEELKYRIKQLEMLRDYLLHLFEGRIFEIKIETKALGHSSTIPIWESPQYPKLRQENEDSEFVIKALQIRIDELKSKFEAA